MYRVVPLFPPLYEQMETAALLGLALALQSYAVATRRAKPWRLCAWRSRSLDAVQAAGPCARSRSVGVRVAAWAWLARGHSRHGCGAARHARVAAAGSPSARVASGTGAASRTELAQMRNVQPPRPTGQGLEDGGTPRVRVVEGTEKSTQVVERRQWTRHPSFGRPAVDIEMRAAAGNGGDAVGGAAARSLERGGSTTRCLRMRRCVRAAW